MMHGKMLNGMTKKIIHDFTSFIQHQSNRRFQCPPLSPSFHQKEPPVFPKSMEWFSPKKTHLRPWAPHSPLPWLPARLPWLPAWLPEPPWAPEPPSRSPRQTRLAWAPWKARAQGSPVESVEGWKKANFGGTGWWNSSKMVGLWKKMDEKPNDWPRIFVGTIEELKSNQLESPHGIATALGWWFPTSSCQSSIPASTGVSLAGTVSPLVGKFCLHTTRAEPLRSWKKWVGEYIVLGYNYGIYGITKWDISNGIYNQDQPRIWSLEELDIFGFVWWCIPIFKNSKVIQKLYIYIMRKMMINLCLADGVIRVESTSWFHHHDPKALCTKCDRARLVCTPITQYLPSGYLT